MRAAHALLALAFVALATGGCGGVAQLTPIDAEDFRAGPLADLQARFTLTETIRTQMTIRIDDHGDSSEVRAILYYRRPDSLRLDVLDPLNAPVAVMRADGGEFSLVDIRHGEAIHAPLTDGLLKRLYGMDLRVSDVRSAILANPFAAGGSSLLEAGLRDGKTVVRRPSERLGHQEEIVVGLLGDEPVVEDWWVRDADGHALQHTSFRSYREVGGILRPMRATVERPTDGMTLSFDATNPELNIELPDTSFRHLFPPGIPVQRWDENGNPVDAPRPSEDQPAP